MILIGDDFEEVPPVKGKWAKKNLLYRSLQQSWCFAIPSPITHLSHKSAHAHTHRGDGLPSFHRLSTKFLTIFMPSSVMMLSG